jgi:hypothetical protein
MTQATEAQVIAALEEGDRIMVTHPDPDKPSEKTRYSLVEASRNVGVRTFKKLVSGGCIRPVLDGLFGDSQTYEWSDGPGEAG